MKPRLCILTSPKTSHVVTHADSGPVNEAFDVVREFDIPQCDVVYTQMYGQKHVFARLEACGVPYVVNVGGDIWDERTALGRTDSLRRIEGVLAGAARVVCVSEFLAGVVRGRLGTENVVSLPGGMWGLDHTVHGVQPGRFSSKQRYDVPPWRRPVVVMNINLTVERKWRGVPVFLEGAAESGARVVCYGKVKGKVGVADAWERQYGMEFRGYTDDWPGALARADLFVHPSMFDGFPRAVADACCVGLPVVVFAVAGAPEVSDSALKIDPDPAAVAGALWAMLSSERLRRETGTAARAEALEKTERHRGDYAKLLREVVG